MPFTSIISIFASIFIIWLSSSAPVGAGGWDWKRRQELRAQADCQWLRRGLPEAAANKSQHVRVEVWQLPSRPKRAAETSPRRPTEAAPDRDNGHGRAHENAGCLTTRFALGRSDSEAGSKSQAFIADRALAIPCCGRTRSGRIIKGWYIRSTLVAGHSHRPLQDNEADSDR